MKLKFHYKMISNYRLHFRSIYLRQWSIYTSADRCNDVSDCTDGSDEQGCGRK